MRQLDVTVANQLGLHARAAARFVQLASRFSSRVTVSKDGFRVDGKSILGLLTLAAAQGSVLRLAAEGDDEESALSALEALVVERFGETA